jgi:hypothetical protein
VDADLDTLATALYVTTDDLLKAHPEQVPRRPAIGIQPRVTDAEIITLAVMQALLSFTSEARFLRYANKHLRQMFPVLPGQSGYNKRLRKLTHSMAWLIGVLATQVSVVTDQVWLVDSTPVECGRSRETVKRSDLRGYAEYGYCASHTRYFLGFRLHLEDGPSEISPAEAEIPERSASEIGIGEERGVGLLLRLGNQLLLCSHDVQCELDIWRALPQGADRGGDNADSKHDLKERAADAVLQGEVVLGVLSSLRDERSVEAVDSLGKTITQPYSSRSTPATATMSPMSLSDKAFLDQVSPTAMSAIEPRST